MGRRATYLCKQCGLSAAVSGGADRGMRAFSQTIWCDHCKKLQDAATRLCDSDIYDGPESVWREIAVRCGICRSEAVQKWGRGQPCPACGGALDVDASSHVMWD